MQSGEAKEEVRSRLAIEDIVGEYVPLKRAGRSWKGISPFTQERTPSFFVSPEKQIWHDFSSNKGGDVFSFVMEVEGLDFRAALELLARKAGVDLSLYQSSGSRDFAKKKQRLLALNDQAATYYQRTLIGDKNAIEYVSKKRGLTKQIVLDFRIGYASSDGNSFMNYALSKGYSKDELQSAGLLGSRGNDMFRSRMMVPLSDGQGQIIGFTARIVVDNPKAPKYLNTPQTLLYDKGRHVFGLYQAKEAIRSNDYAVIVEGNLDVISSHQVDVRQVVATAGTAMTEHHLKALSRLTHNIRLCFDGDKAGIAATERAIPIAESVGVELSVITLPADFKDPDEVVQHDSKLWQSVIESPQPAIEWVIDQYQERYDLTTASGKRELSTQALQLIRGLKDPVEQEHYLDRVSEVTGASREALLGKIRRQAESDVPKKHKPMQVEVSNDHDPEVHQDYLLGLACIDPSIHDSLRHLVPEAATGSVRRRLLGYILANRGQSLDGSLPEELHEIETYVKIVTFKAETRYGSVDKNDRLTEAVHLVQRVQKEQRKVIKQKLDVSLKDAESSGDDERANEIRQQLNHLIKEMKRA